VKGSTAWPLRVAARPDGEAAAIWLRLGAIVAIGLLALLFFAARPPLLPSDDAAIYVSSAQALARGLGYRLLGYPAEPANTFYPPGYSIALLPPFVVQPDFPANLPLLQFASLIVFLAFLGLATCTLQCSGASTLETALALLLAASTPLALFQSTAVMSDTLYGALALGSVLLVHAGQRESGRRAWLLLLGGGLLATAACYTRLVGLALLGAFAVDLLRRREADWRRVAVLLLPAALVLPWFVTAASLGGSGYLRHWQDGTPGWSLSMDGPETLLLVLVGNLLLGGDILTVVAPAVVDKSVLPGVTPMHPLAWLAAASLYCYVLWQSWLRWRRGGGLVHLYLLFYLLLTALWPYRVLGRLLWPVAPLLAWYLVTGLARLWAPIAEHLGTRARADLLIVGALLLANAAWLVDVALRTAAGEWVGNPTDKAAVLAMHRASEYLNALDPGDSALGSNHVNAAAWWFLYTGHQGFDAVVRADGAQPFYVRRALQGDPETIRYFVYHRNNGSTPRGGEADLPLVLAALEARHASTTPLYCTDDGGVCIFDWRAGTQAAAAGRALEADTDGEAAAGSATASDSP